MKTNLERIKKDIEELSSIIRHPAGSLTRWSFTKEGREPGNI